MVLYKLLMYTVFVFALLLHLVFGYHCSSLYHRPEVINRGTDRLWASKKEYRVHASFPLSLPKKSRHSQSRTESNLILV